MARPAYRKRREPKNSGAKATPPQIRALQIAQRRLDLEDAVFRGLLQEETGKTSRGELTLGEASRMIDVLVQKYGFDIRRSARPPRQKTQGRPRKTEKVITLASSEELDKIAALARLVEWRVKDGFESWLKTRMHIESVRTADEAYRAIEGLKSMFENQMKKKHGPAWWKMDHGDPGIMFYIAEHCRKGKEVMA